MPPDLQSAIHEACEAIRRLPATNTPLEQMADRGLERGKYDATLPIRQRLLEVLDFLQPFEGIEDAENFDKIPRPLVVSLVGEMESLKKIADEIPVKCQRQTTSVVPPSYHGAEAGAARRVEAIYSKIYSQLLSLRTRDAPPSSPRAITDTEPSRRKEDPIQDSRRPHLDSMPSKATITDPNQWRSIAPYAAISLFSFLCGMGVLGLLIWKADKLIGLGLTGNLYYIALLPLAASAAAFLFGVLKSYARYQGKQLGGVLELGGPIVGFALVIIGGFVLVKSPDTLPLTVYVHGQRGIHDTVLKNSGYVVLDLGPDRRREPIGDKGQAYFPAIPANFRRQEISIWVESDVVEVVDPVYKRRLDSTSLYVAVQKKAGRISGRIQDSKGNPVSGAVIHVAGLSTSADGAGYFELSIPGDRLKPELDLQALAPGYSPSRHTVVPNANELTITLTLTP